MNKRYTFTERKIYDALPDGRIRVYYDERESTEKVKTIDRETEEERTDSYPVWSYLAVTAESISRSSIIVALIRAKYTEDDEMAMQRQKDDKISEFNKYSSYVEWCKAYSLRVLNGDTLETAKALKIAELGQYDASPAVNSFAVGNEATWLSPASRSNYLLTIQAAQAAGVEVVIFEGITLPVASALAALNAINVYAMQCVAVTASHKAAINALDTIAAVDAYDFTTGYPEKLSF